MDEALTKRRQYESAKVNRHFLDSLVFLPNGRSGLQHEMRDAFRAHGVEPGGLTSFTLRLAYDSITHELNTKYGRLEIHRTASERHFAKVFRSVSKKHLLPSFWIGNHCVDYFCPSIRVGKHIGVAFEIDGSIHQRNFKQRKDTHGEAVLEALRIWTKRIENEDLGCSTVKHELDWMCRQKPVDSKSVKYQMVQIYTHTIAIFATKWHFQLFGISGDLLDELVSIYERRMGGTVRFKDSLIPTDNGMTFPCVAGGAEYKNLPELQNAYIVYLAEIEFEKEGMEQQHDEWQGLGKRMLYNWVDVMVHDKPHFQIYREALLTLGNYRAQMRVKTRPLR